MKTDPAPLSLRIAAAAMIALWLLVVGLGFVAEKPRIAVIVESPR